MALFKLCKQGGRNTREMRDKKRLLGLGEETVGKGLMECLLRGPENKIGGFGWSVYRRKADSSAGLLHLIHFEFCVLVFLHT